MEQSKNAFYVLRLLLLIFILHLSNSSIFFNDYIYLPSQPRGQPALASPDKRQSGTAFVGKLALLFVDGLYLSHNLTRLPSVLLRKIAYPPTRLAGVAQISTGFQPSTRLQDFLYSYSAIQVHTALALYMGIDPGRRRVAGRDLEIARNKYKHRWRFVLAQAA